MVKIHSGYDMCRCLNKIVIAKRLSRRLELPMLCIDHAQHGQFCV